ncbi:acyl-CoA thioesterase [Streptosporangium sp. NPDC000396]|uniref:acyl-CoA thioesterase n=1 Tax=Streptosporangium sp. NPDC000396 TaxID=3366185 RepID=UPI003677EC2D
MNLPLDVRRRVEHVDTDAAGVVHFSRYASLLETAVLENLEHLGVGLRLFGEHGLELAVSELRMKFVAPARFYDQIRVSVHIDHVGGASCQVSGQIHRLNEGSSTLLASGTLMLCAVDGARGVATALPAQARTALRGRLNGDGDD